VYFNKYIDGHPYLCEAVEMSSTGMLVRRVREPDAPRAAYALELASGPLSAGESRVWLLREPGVATRELEALAFVGQSAHDTARIEEIIARVAA